jgi:acetylglutamate kinase
MKDVGQPAAEVSLKQAIPYIRMFKGKTFVLKVGGGALETAATARALVEQIEILHQLGIRVVLVHGGGAQASAVARSLGVEPRFVLGRRVTDAAMLEVTAMVLNGLVNTRLLALCRSAGLPAVGLSGVDAGLIEARRRPPVAIAGDLVDYGQVGDVVAVDPRPLEALLDAGMVPIVSPLSAAADGTLLNVNADTAAAALAGAMRAAKLIFLTGAPGILERAGDPGSLVSYTDLAGLARLRAQESFADGMLPKASAIEAAIAAGVARVHILSHDLPDGLLAELFTNDGVGTLVVASTGSPSPPAPEPRQPEAALAAAAAGGTA